jgi:hypothetical protein
LALMQTIGGSVTRIVLFAFVGAAGAAAGNTIRTIKRVLSS